MLARRPLMVALVLLAACGGGSADAPTTPTPPTPPVPPMGTVPTAIPVTFGAARLDAELASRAAQRATGLSNRATMAADSGMLFVFARPQLLFFWMKDTRMPLSIAFLDSSRRVLNIREMAALDTVTVHQSAGLALYALEANRGWFAARGVVPGAVANFTLPAGLVIDP